jgi:hypothetical protein
VHRNVRFVATLVQGGADVHRLSRGLSAAFWANVLMLEDDTGADVIPRSLFELNAVEAAALERLDVVKRTDVRNAAILDCTVVPRAPAGAADAAPEGSVLSQLMAEGVAAGSDRMVAAATAPGPRVPLSGGSGCAVMDFLSRQGRVRLGAGFDRVLHSAKVFTIGFVASGAGDALGLSPAQALALRVFTTSVPVFTAVNAALRAGDDADTWRPFVQLLHSALLACPVYVGEAYRGVATAFDASGAGGGVRVDVGGPARDVVAVGGGGYVCAAAEWKGVTPLVVSKKGTVQMFQTRSARDVSAFSNAPHVSSSTCTLAWARVARW